MKNKGILLVFLLSFCFFSPSIVRASNNYVITNNCSIKTAPNDPAGSEYSLPSKVAILDPSDIVIIEDLNNKVASSSSKCNSFYYKVKYAGESGYVCGDFINFEQTGKYYDYLKDEQGFTDLPEQYLLSLNYLKTIHPNWEFEPVKININWNEIISVQSSVGKNYISVTDPNGKDAVYLSLDGGSYDPSSKTFIRQEPNSWYAANKYTVSYYMDPRNYLNERDIFAFESNYYNKNLSEENIKNSLSEIFKNNTVLSGYINDYTETKNIGINPSFLATRSRLEVASGSGVSSAASGTKGYYNFFNIGSYSSCNNPQYCGNIFAGSKGWNTPNSAILGGAYWIYENYLERNQKTLYFQKFNVSNSSNLNSHQYMTNILAPKTEAGMLYKGYNAAGILDTKTTFYIPVYLNMPEVTSNLPTAINPDDLKNAESGKDNPTNTLNISDIVNGANFKYNNGYILGIKPETTVSNVVSSLKAISSSASIIISDKNNTLVSTQETLKTGYKITITNNNNTETIAVVIRGDNTGDGKTTVADLLALQQHLLKTKVLTDEYYLASDVDNDSNVTVNDLLKIQKTLLNNDTINP